MILMLGFIQKDCRVKGGIGDGIHFQTVVERFNIKNEIVFLL